MKFKEFGHGSYCTTHERLFDSFKVDKKPCKPVEEYYDIKLKRQKLLEDDNKSSC